VYILTKYILNPVVDFLSIPPFSKAGIQTFSRYEQKQDFNALDAAQISNSLSCTLKT